MRVVKWDPFINLDDNDLKECQKEDRGGNPQEGRAEAALDAVDAMATD
jgi:hypothetical protein